MSSRPLTVAWISYFPVEWLDDVPEEIRLLPKQHPASWQRVLLAELEKRQDLKLHIFVLRKHFLRSRTFERHGVVFHLIKTIGGLRAASCYWLDTFLIRRELERLQPDMVHAWGAETGAALIAGRLGYPFLVTMQGLLNWIGELVPVNRHERFLMLVEDCALWGASVVTAESSFAMKYLGGRHPHLELHQIEHSPLPLFYQVKRQPVLQPIRLLFVGNFSYLKGCDLLVAALAELPRDFDFEMICVGTVDKAFATEMQGRTRPEVWSRIKFMGSRSAAEIAVELSAAALFVYPSRCDNSPNAVKEAVVAGVPVVASAVGGIVDYVRPGWNGLLFDSGDAVGLARCLQGATTHPLFSKGLVEAVCHAGVRDYLSPETMARSFVAQYRRLVSAAG